MDLKEIASVSGKSGLFKILGPTRSGLILQSLDEAGTKLVTPASQKVSVLDEISIYTTTAEGTVPLSEVLKSVHNLFGQDLNVDPDGGNAVLSGFMEKVLPDYDRQRVYQSDIKKLVRWYNCLIRFAPEVINSED
ncbi:MAG: DUF5606 domain-containing protein [Cyclobacteriaceae bacterium]